MARLSYVLSERPAGVEPAHPPWQGDRLPLHHGRFGWKPNCQGAKSTGRDSNPRHRMTTLRAVPGAVSLPLSRPVLVSGTGGHRTHIVRFKRPVHCLVCHSPVAVGAEGVEPSTWSL